MNQRTTMKMRKKSPRKEKEAKGVNAAMTLIGKRKYDVLFDLYVGNKGRRF